MTEPHRWGTAPGFIGPRHELREQLLLDLFLSAHPGPRILDAGAGQGTMTRRLRRLGFDVESTDVSAAAVGALRERFGTRVRQADVTRLPYEDGAFDGAILGEVLEHVGDDRLALREVARVVSRTGVVAASVPAHPKLFGASDRWAGHVRRYERGGLIRACAEAQLEVVTCLAWGFPVARLYHRHLYERYLERRGPAEAGSRTAPLLAVLRALLQIDRLFVGVERGSLGYLLLARRR